MSISSLVPELSFIDKEYKFSVYVDCIAKDRAETREIAVLSRDYLKIGKIKLPLNKRSLERVKTYYEDGEISMVSVDFWAKGYSYNILNSKECFATISASKKTKANYSLYSGSVVKNLSPRRLCR